MRVLFVCNVGRHRSRTAAEVFANDFDTDYAGLYSSIKPVTAQAIAWADVVCVMDSEMQATILRKYSREIRAKRLLNLHIPNVYSFEEPALIEELKRKIKSTGIVKD